MPYWIPAEALLAMHQELMAEHGGAVGSVDKALFESTLARPQQHAAYTDPEPDTFTLAAAYGFGFAKNHCFTDGNKRIALAAIDVFLIMNGHELIASEPEAVTVIHGLAMGSVDERQLTEWIRQNSRPIT
ncbi:MAG: death-on-curing family protein [Gammaproteobacteria bacterium]|nr:MAG: death-on-curing family protein [Gammaproteobacteria bacterium]TND01128.1 MAG: death-on-curing family protein [Gammaproteobacteria bacterium]